MEKQFLPYEQALALKELGFDEPCFGTYLSSLQSDWKVYELILEMGMNEEFEDNRNVYLSEGACSAPTFSQAFRWLLKHHNLYGVIIPTETMNWTFKTMTVVEGIVEVPPYKHVDSNDYGTPEEAELACLIFLIELQTKKR